MISHPSNPNQCCSLMPLIGLALSKSLASPREIALSLTCSDGISVVAILVPWTALKNSTALLIDTCLDFTFSVAILFKHPQIPSTGPFPWLVALKFQQSRTPCFCERIFILATTNRFLNWLEGPSVQIRTSSAAAFVWSMKSLTMTLEFTVCLNHITVGNRVTWFWFQWAVWTSSWAPHA